MLRAIGVESGARHQTGRGRLMYYLILKSDMPPAGNVLRYVARNVSKSVLEAVSFFNPANIQSIGWNKSPPAFVENHPINDTSQPGNPQCAAAIYQG